MGTFPFAAFALWTLGAGPVDAVLLSVPLLLPWWCGALPPRQRQRLLRLELPVLAAFAAAVGVAMAASNARLVGASVPWRSGFVFGGYVLLWVVALRLARDGLRHLAMRWLLRRPKLADVLATLLTVGLGFPQLYVGLQTHRIAMPQRPDPHLDGVQIEEVAFATSDAVPLRGTLLRQRGTAPVVVVCHGVGANRAVFFPLAEIAAGLGCHALAFDFRAHGESGGWVSTFGAREVLDVAAAVAWLRQDPQFTTAPVVLVGVSLGAATVLRAAKAVGAAGVLAESAFADLATMIETQTAVLGPASHVVAAVIGLAARCQLGVDVASVSPRASLAELPADVPVVLLHAGDDTIIPLAEGRRLAAARPGTRLEVFAGTSHGGCSTADRARFRRLLGALVGR